MRRTYAHLTEIKGTCAIRFQHTVSFVTRTQTGNSEPWAQLDDLKNISNIVDNKSFGKNNTPAQDLHLKIYPRECWKGSVISRNKSQVFAFLCTTRLFFPSPCPPVMCQSSVGGFACYLGSRYNAWTLFLARRFPFTDVETSRLFRYSHDRSFR